jgi:hypothetical protein
MNDEKGGSAHRRKVLVHPSASILDPFELADDLGKICLLLDF